MDNGAETSVAVRPVYVVAVTVREQNSTANRHCENSRGERMEQENQCECVVQGRADRLAR